eukprot:scaffold874_cov126-Cylindrotheca_fusiformis.AAC.4
MSINRLAQWISMWKHSDTAFTKSTYEEFMCNSRDIPKLRAERLDMLGAQMNPLLAAAAFLRQGWNVQMLDMGGVEKARKDVMHVIACELLMGNCKDGFLMYAMHDKKINSSPSLDEAYSDFNDAESDKIEMLFRYRDCGLRDEIIDATAATGSKFEILYNQSVWGSCYDESKQSVYRSLASDTETLYHALLSQLNCPEDQSILPGGIRGIGTKKKGKEMSKALGIEDDPLTLDVTSLILPLWLVVLGLTYVFLVKVKGVPLQKILFCTRSRDTHADSKYSKKNSSAPSILGRLYPSSKLYGGNGKSSWYWGWSKQSDPNASVPTPVNNSIGTYSKPVDSPAGSSRAEGYGISSYFRWPKDTRTSQTGAAGTSSWSAWYYGKRSTPEQHALVIGDDEASESSEEVEDVRILDDENEEEETIKVEAYSENASKNLESNSAPSKVESVSSILSYFRTSSYQDDTKEVEDEIAQLAAEMTKQDQAATGQSSSLFTYFRSSTESAATENSVPRTSGKGEMLSVIEEFEEGLEDGTGEEVVVFDNNESEGSLNVFNDPVLEPLFEPKQLNEWTDNDEFSQLFDGVKVKEATEDAPTEIESAFPPQISKEDELGTSSINTGADNIGPAEALEDSHLPDAADNHCFKIDDDDSAAGDEGDFLNEALDQAVNEMDEFTMVYDDTKDDFVDFQSPREPDNTQLPTGGPRRQQFGTELHTGGKHTEPAQELGSDSSTLFSEALTGSKPKFATGLRAIGKNTDEPAQLSSSGSGSLLSDASIGIEPKGDQVGEYAVAPGEGENEDDSTSIQEQSVVSIDLLSGSSDTDQDMMDDDGPRAEDVEPLEIGPNQESQISDYQIPAHSDTMGAMATTENGQPMGIGYRKPQRGSDDNELDPKTEKKAPTSSAASSTWKYLWSSQDNLGEPPGESADAPVNERLPKDNASPASGEARNEIVSSGSPSKSLAAVVGVPSLGWGWTRSSSQQEPVPADSTALAPDGQSIDGSQPDKVDEASPVPNQPVNEVDSGRSSKLLASVVRVPSMRWSWTASSPQQEPGKIGSPSPETIQPNEEDSACQEPSAVLDTDREDLDADVVVIKKVGLVLYKDDVSDENVTCDRQGTDTAKAKAIGDDKGEDEPVRGDIEPQQPPGLDSGGDEVGADVVVVKKAGLVLYKDEVVDKKATGDAGGTDNASSIAAVDDQENNRQEGHIKLQTEGDENLNMTDEIARDPMANEETVVSSAGLNTSGSKGWLWSWSSPTAVIEPKVAPESEVLDAGKPNVEKVLSADCDFTEAEQSTKTVHVTVAGAADHHATASDGRNGNNVRDSKQQLDNSNVNTQSLPTSLPSSNKPVSRGNKTEMPTGSQDQLQEQKGDQSDGETMLPESKQEEVVKSEVDQLPEQNGAVATKPAPASKVLSFWSWGSAKTSDDQAADSNEKIKSGSSNRVDVNVADSSLLHLDEVHDTQEEGRQALQDADILEDGSDDIQQTGSDRRASGWSWSLSTKSVTGNENGVPSAEGEHLSKEDDKNTSKLVDPEVQGSNLLADTNFEDSSSVPDQKDRSRNVEVNVPEISPRSGNSSHHVEKTPATSVVWGLLWSKSAKETKPEPDHSDEGHEAPQNQNTQTQGDETDQIAKDQEGTALPIEPKDDTFSEKRDPSSLREGQSWLSSKKRDTEVNEIAEAEGRHLPSNGPAVASSEEIGVVTKKPDNESGSKNGDDEASEHGNSSHSAQKAPAPSKVWGLLWTKSAIEKDPREDHLGTEKVPKTIFDSPEPHNQEADQLIPSQRQQDRTEDIGEIGTRLGGSPPSGKNYSLDEGGKIHEERAN